METSSKRVKVDIESTESLIYIIPQKIQKRRLDILITKSREKGFPVTDIFWYFFINTPHPDDHDMTGLDQKLTVGIPSHRERGIAAGVFLKKMVRASNKLRSCISNPRRNNPNSTQTLKSG